jgi:hypothetical protein
MDSLGVLPFKDCFWSNSSVQPGCASNVSICQEPNADLQTLVSRLSGGPLAPADRIGYLNLENINQTIRSDGIILKADTPARTMDLAFFLGFKSGPTLLNLTSTSSSHRIQDGQMNPTFKWHYIVAADTLQEITIMPSDLGEVDNGNTFFVFDYYQKPTQLSRFQASSPLVIPALEPNRLVVSFKYYVVFQASNSYSLIGERNKFALASGQRFTSITKSTENGVTTTTVSFSGAPKEQVSIEMLHTPTTRIESYTCLITGTSSSLTCTESSTSNSCSCGSKR